MLTAEVAKLLFRRLEEERVLKAASVLAGVPKNIEDYREAIGYLRALDHVMLWAEEINKKLQQDG